MQSKPSAPEVLCLLAGAFLTIQYAWWMDDAFVYFRYVDNLLYLHLGLVYNRGEYVEGFSSPLWVLLLCVLRWAGLDWWLLVRLVGLAAFACFGIGILRLNRRLSPASAPVVDLPLAYLATNYAVACYFTSGLETPWVQVAAVAFAALVVHPSSRGLQAAVGLAPLLRHELALPWLVAVLWTRFRTSRWPYTLLGVGVGATGAWLAFRVVYYAELLPNPYYLKDTVALAQGWTYLLDTALTYHVPLFAAVALGLLVAARRPRATGPSVATDLFLVERGVMLVAALLVTAYVVKIGGDARHYRYLAFPFCLAVCAAGGLAEHVVGQRIVRSIRPRAWRVAARGVPLLVAVGVAASYPPQLDGHPLRAATQQTTVDGINDAHLHRLHPTLSEPPWGWSTRPDLRPRFARWRRRDPQELHAAARAEYWCASLYRDFDTRAIHALGLTDPVLAHIDLPADRPAHKFGLVPIAEYLARLSEQENGPGVDMYRRSLAAGRAPAWVQENLAALELIERKRGNRHRFLENLRLALTPVPRLRVATDDSPSGD